MDNAFKDSILLTDNILILWILFNTVIYFVIFTLLRTRLEVHAKAVPRVSKLLVVTRSCSKFQGLAELGLVF